MTWVKLDDNFTDHPKVDALSDAAFRLHVAALCYCNRHLTDGFVPAAALGKLTPHARPGLSASELVAKGTWFEAQGGFQVHDYLDFQESAEQVKARRKDDADRKREARKKGRSPAATANGPARRPPGLRPDSVSDSAPESGRTPHRTSAPESGQESTRPDPTRPNDLPPYPPPGHEPEAPEAEGGSGYADEEPQGEPADYDARYDEDRTATEPTPDPMRRIDALLRKVCPPERNRLYGAPRADLRAALAGGADPELVLAAIRQGDATEGAFLRAGRAMTAIADGRVHNGGGAPVRPYEAPAWVDDPPADPAVVADALAEARAALKR